MGNDAKTSKTKNPKKANLLDHHSLKHILDESVTEIITSRGYVEDVRMSNIRLLSGTIIIIVALVAQFYPKKFPENRTFLISLYCPQRVVAADHKHKGKECHLVHLSTTRALNFETKLASHSYLPCPVTWVEDPTSCPPLSSYQKASADPKSISANKPVEFTQSITKWFTKDGLLVEGLFWKDVEGLVDEYAKEKKSK